MLRTTRSGIELLGGMALEWSTLGLGLGALLIASPSVRRGARNLLVSTLAGGMRMAQGISDFGGQVRQEMSSAMASRQGQPPQPQEPPVMPEAPMAH